MKKILLIIAILGISTGIGFAIQNQTEIPIIVAESSSISTEIILPITNTLTEADILRIISENKEMLKCEKGDDGEQGIKGDKGDIGFTGIGEKGESGDKGEVGEIGKQGEKGDRGEQGEQGLIGEKGDMPDGNWKRYCITSDGERIVYYPIDEPYCALMGPDGQYCGDLCEDGYDGEKVYLWFQN